MQCGRSPERDRILLHISQNTLDVDELCSQSPHTIELLRSGWVGGVKGDLIDFCCLVYLIRFWFSHSIADVRVCVWFCACVCVCVYITPD